MQGRRRPDGTKAHELEPGDYAKMATEGVFANYWVIRPPNNAEGKSWPGTLSPKIHSIVENPDGTITVNPSIKQTAGNPPDGEYELWHGWLENGVWRL